jgi:small subunit ribosomal protein S20
LSTRYHSGIKAKRQNETHKARNKAEMSQIRTQVKKTRALAVAGKQEEANELMPQMFAVLDKGVKHGRLHKNTAARRKSRIAKKLALAAKS